jgi:5-methylcytosine-specific restriction endonuclease McrA
MRSSGKWKRMSEEIREKANHLCEVCRDRGAYTYNNLEVHHIIKVRENGDGLLDPLNTICLCVVHHKEADRGDIDADYLRMLARRREGIEDRG